MAPLWPTQHINKRCQSHTAQLYNGQTKVLTHLSVLNIVALWPIHQQTLLTWHNMAVLWPTQHMKKHCQYGTAQPSQQANTSVSDQHSYSMGNTPTSIVNALQHGSTMANPTPQQTYAVISKIVRWQKLSFLHNPLFYFSWMTPRWFCSVMKVTRPALNPAGIKLLSTYRYILKLPRRGYKSPFLSRTKQGSN